MPKISWTKDRKSEFRTMWERGDTKQQIAEHFGINPNVVQAYAWKFRFRPRRSQKGWTSKELNELKRLYKLNFPRATIAMMLGRCANSIARALSYYRICTPSRCISERDKQRIKTLLVRHSVSVVARRLGIGETAVRTHAKRMGVAISTSRSKAQRLRHARDKKKHGYLSTTSIKWIREREANSAIGWPPVTNTEARLLQSMIDRNEPMTIAEIGAAIGIRTVTANGRQSTSIPTRMKKFVAKGYALRIGKCPASWVVAGWVIDQRAAYLKGGV